MAERIISEETINAFREYLVLEEKKLGHRGEISPGCPCFSFVCIPTGCDKRADDGL